MTETRGIVAMMERSYRDVRDTGLSIDEFERRAHDRGHTAILVRAWRRYEELLRSLPAVDSADVLLYAAKKIEAGAPIAPQVVAGFYDMTGAQLAVVRALEKAGKLKKILVPIGEGDAYAFASRFVSQLKSSLIPQPSSLHIKEAKPIVEQYAMKEAELRGICASVRALLDDGVAPMQIGITARSLDPDDIRLLQRFAADNGFAISARNDLALSGHRIGRGVSTILRLRDRNFARADVVDILRDGYMPRAEVPINDVDKATRRARISGGASADIRNANNDAAIEQYRAVVAELEAIPMAVDRIAARFRIDTELDLAALAKLDDIAALVARWKHKVDRETILELIAQTELRQPTTDNRQPVVWAGDVMKFRGRSFEHLFVIRAQESTLPQRRVSDPLLPDHERRALRIREIGDGREEERLLFQLLLDGATSVRFSFSTSDAFGKILRPSRMLRGFTHSQAIAGTRDSGPGTNFDRQAQLVKLAGTRSSFDGYLDEKIYTLIRDKLQALSPTQLENFGECPQKFLLKTVFDVRDYDDPNRELQMPQREKGRLDHTVLERFYRSLDHFPPRDTRERLDAIVDAAFDEDELRVPAFNRVMRGIERRATKRHLHAFLADDIEDLLVNELRPKEFEYELEPFALAGHEVPITLKGIIDRIDEGRESLRIIDYKSGKAEKYEKLAEKIARGVRLQLAFYAIAIAERFDTPNVSGAIKPLMPGSKRDTMTFDLAASERAVRETLDLFIRSMLRGVFPAFPEVEACKYCPVKLSCRTRHSDHETRSLEQFDDPRALLESLA
ncbi:MAG TPA: PD-(D/E)XK nuclease family protein [Thermoanaerobaculia bacterium]|nr:PD-(D/E)XK nuclease family protein [Thermoanaerobaculia bacterium]